MTEAETAPVYVPIHKRRGVVGVSTAKGPQPKPNTNGAPIAATTEASANEKKIRNIAKVIFQRLIFVIS